MRFRVEPGARGGWRVMLEGVDAPVSEHDTEEEAQARAGRVRARGRGSRCADAGNGYCARRARHAARCQ